MPVVSGVGRSHSGSGSDAVVGTPHKCSKSKASKLVSCSIGSPSKGFPLRGFGSSSDGVRALSDSLDSLGGLYDRVVRRRVVLVQVLLAS